MGREPLFPSITSFPLSVWTKRKMAKFDCGGSFGKVFLNLAKKDASLATIL
jgi:hypothetical protein